MNCNLLALLGIEHPVIQGPMGGGQSSVELAGTVSDGGGLGSFGAHHLSPDEIGRLVRDLRERTSKPFSVNLWVSQSDEDSPDWTFGLERLRPYFEEVGVDLPQPPKQVGYPFAEQVRVLLEAGPPVFSFVFGIPPAEVLHSARERGITTIGSATTADEAVALEAAGVDVVVASGQEGGGHRGSFLRPAEESLIGTIALVPQIVDRVRVPVIAAGGMADVRGVRAALALGASGAQLGTAFLATDESAAHPLHKELLLNGPRWTALTRAFSGRLARGLVNRALCELEEPLPYPAQNYLMGRLRGPALAAGRTDLVSLWAGQGAPLLHHRSAAELLRSLVP